MLTFAEQQTRSYGWPRLVLCFLLPGLLARALGGSGPRYMRAFVLSDLGLLVANLVVDYGPSEAVRHLPDEAGLWPPRQRRHRLRDWLLLLSAGLLVLGPLSPLLATAAHRASKHPAGGFLNWRPIEARWSLSSVTPHRLLSDIPFSALAEECYIHGLLWSRMAWLGRWRPFANALAWAGYHLNRPVKDMLAGILPGALLASCVRGFTGNIYWNFSGHYLSNAFYSWLAYRNLRGRPPSEEISTTELIASSH